MTVLGDGAATERWAAQPEPELDEIVDALGEIGPEPRLQPGERRQVALLFVELQDLYSWEEILKGAELRAVLDKVYAVFSGIVASFGGYIDRTEGAMVLALFGNRAASELDAERAVRAALDMFDKLHNINRYLSRRGIHLDIKAGVHVGTIAVDAAGSVQGGEAVQVALGVNRSAAVNTLLISRQTQDLVGDVFLFESLGRIHLGDGAQPQPVYRVVGPNPQGEGRWQRASLVRRSGFVGRRRVLAALNAAWEVARDPEAWAWDNDPFSVGRRWVSPTFMGIQGDAGSGKSRIMMEFRSRLGQLGDDAPEMLIGRADPLAHTSYGLFVNVLKRFCGIQAQDSTQVRRRKLEASARPLFISDPVLKAYLPVMGWLVGVIYDEAPLPEGNPKAVQEEIHIAMTAFMRSMAIHCHKKTRQPLVVFLKDLHAADERSVATLMAILDRMRVPLPVIFVASWRSGYRPPRELGLVCRLQVLTLGPLSHDEVQQLVGSMLDGFRLPTSIVRQVQRLASGNPFFVEELVRNLVEDQVLVKTETGWKLERSDAAVTLPQSLSGLILARVDTLPREVRDTLVCASAIGVVFSRAILAEVSRRLGRPNPEAHLKVLCEGRFVRPIPVAREASYSFPNLLSREVVYGTLLPENRRLLHRLSGEAILRIYKDNLPEHFGTLGGHFALGGERAQAQRYLALAAEKALAENSNDLALGLLRRRLALGVEGAEALRVRFKTAEVLRRVGRLDEASSMLEALIADEGEPDSGPEGVALSISFRLELCSVRRLQGDREQALLFAEQARALADATSDRSQGLVSRFTRVQCLRQLGRWDDTTAAIDDLSAQVTPADGDRWVGLLASERGRLALARGDFANAATAFEDALRSHLEQGDKAAQVADICNLSEALLGQGQVTGARIRLSEAVALVGGMRDEPMAAATRMLRGAIQALSGEVEGLAAINRTLDDCERRGNRPATLLGHRLRMRVLSHLGRDLEAAEAARLAGERFGPGALP